MPSYYTFFFKYYSSTVIYLSYSRASEKCEFSSAITNYIRIFVILFSNTKSADSRVKKRIETNVRNFKVYLNLFHI